MSEASNPISGGELDFLAEAARRIEYVVLVLSKVDLLDDRGVERARENEETIYNSPRFTADRFAESTFLRFSAKVGADSGLRPLRERLDHVAAHYRVYGQLNAMRAMQSMIAQASVELAQHRSAAENPLSQCNWTASRDSSLSCAKRATLGDPARRADLEIACSAAEPEQLLIG